MKLNKYVLRWEQHEISQHEIHITAPSVNWILDNFDTFETAFRLESETGCWTTYEEVVVDDGPDDEQYYSGLSTLRDWKDNDDYEDEEE